MSEETAAAAPAGKVDPETLALRGSPIRVTRFRREAIIAISGTGLILISGIVWFALRSASPVLAPAEDRGAAAARAPSDALEGAPTSYGDVPRLGPRLPGDLGRPILRRQRQPGVEGPAEEMAAWAADEPAARAGDEAAARAAAEAEAERQRLAAEERAARGSAIIISSSNREQGMAGHASRPAEVGADGPSLGGASDLNGQARKNAMVGAATGGGGTSAHRLAPPASPWTIHAGSIVAASLITGLNSDLPGFVTAQVTENVHDSVTGRTLLIPQGSRLIGSYDSVVAFGQSRALVVWQRLLLPDGSSIAIDNVPATDTAGYAGLSDRIDRHTWQLLKGVALSTLLGVGTELGAGSSESDLVRAIRESSQQAGARAGDQIVARSLDVQPTLKVRPGFPLRIVVHKDIVLRPWTGGGE